MEIKKQQEEKEEINTKRKFLSRDSEEEETELNQNARIKLSTCRFMQNRNCKSLNCNVS